MLKKKSVGFQDSILLTDDLEFNFDDPTDVPQLQPFIDQLAKGVLKSAFFRRQVKEKINVLNIPIIMADCLVGTMTNTERNKKSLMNVTKKYKKNVLANLIDMVSSKQLDILGLDNLNPSEMKNIAKKIGISVSKKSNTVLLEELKSLAKVFLAGQGTVVNQNFTKLCKITLL